jgi:hypothetical protein
VRDGKLSCADAVAAAPSTTPASIANPRLAQRIFMAASEAMATPVTAYPHAPGDV